jgi:hypothetical protein
MTHQIGEARPKYPSNNAGIASVIPSHSTTTPSIDKRTFTTMTDSTPMTKVLIFGGKTGWIGGMMYQNCMDQGT